MTGNALRYLAVVAIAGSFGVAPSSAHPHPCPHSHEPTHPQRLISCTQCNAACTQGGNGGNCKQIAELSSAWCECDASAAADASAPA